MFLVHPSWTLPVSPVNRALIYFGLAGYFAFLSYISRRWINDLEVGRQSSVCSCGQWKDLKEHILLIALCVVAALLHIAPILSPIYLVGDEGLFLQNGLWIYDFLGASWHEAARYIFWLTLVAACFIAIRKRNGSFEGLQSADKSEKGKSVLYAVLGVSFLVAYFFLLYDLPFHQRMVRYPPVQNFLYMISYLAFGINHVGARLWQLLFYIFTAVYIYKAINLFSDKGAGLLGASIYLFSPIIFAYAHFAELASGLIFFMVVVSYYFLRFVVYHDARALVLASFFIGTGFLYKRDMFLMFFICAAYLVLQKVRNREFGLVGSLKVLSLSLFPIIPWMVIGKYFNWRNAWINLSQFASFDTVMAYMLSIPAQLSWAVFILFLLACIYVLIKERNDLTLFWGFLFVSFYAFYTSQNMHTIAHRFTMAFYPTIAIFISLFLSGIAGKLRWKHSFSLIFGVLTVYLVMLSVVPSFSNRLIEYKHVKAQYFPNEQAMQWVRDNVKAGEKVLTFRFKPDLYYSDKYGIDKGMIDSYWYGTGDMEKVMSPHEFREYCRDNGISYVLFPYGPMFGDNAKNRAIRDYVKDNKDKEFVEVAKFNLGDNYVYIHRVGVLDK